MNVAAKLFLLTVAQTLCACPSHSAQDGEAGEGHAHEAHDERHEGEAHALEPGTRDLVVALTPEQRVSAQIATATVSRRAEAGLLVANAVIEAAADLQARVGPRVAGRITSLGAGVGDRVKKGQVLAELDSAELGRAKADYLAALAVSEVAEGSAGRERALFEKKISSEKDWREAQASAIKARAERDAAENRLHALGLSDADLPELKDEGHYSSSIPITAPISGAVVERSVTLGEMVESTDSLFIVMDLREVWILVDVYERDLPKVRVEQRATIRVAAYPERSFEGTVQSIGAIVEPRTRAVKVRVVLENPGGVLKPGMFATVTLRGTEGAGRERLLLPSTAVARDGDRTIVFVPRGDLEFELREVKLGIESGGLVEVITGLSAGEPVVTRGAFQLKSELQKAKLGGGHAH